MSSRIPGWFDLLITCCDELYQSKELRDRRYWGLKARGVDVERFRSTNLELHPQFVEDLKDTPAGKDNRVGNAHYKTYFRVLYGVRERRKD